MRETRVRWEIWLVMFRVAPQIAPMYEWFVSINSKVCEFLVIVNEGVSHFRRVTEWDIVSAQKILRWVAEFSGQGIRIVQSNTLFIVKLHLYIRLHVSAPWSHHQACTVEQIQIWFCTIGIPKVCSTEVYCPRCTVKLKLLGLKWIPIVQNQIWICSTVEVWWWLCGAETCSLVYKCILTINWCVSSVETTNKM
jgi:hypothetical protein